MKRQIQQTPAAAIVHLLLFSALVFLFIACNKHPTLFHKISSSQSGIHFNNSITENDSINPLSLEFLYNGGGVAVGDFNKDGLPDLYFTASIAANKLYLNKEKLSFEDITEKAGVAGEGRWRRAESGGELNKGGGQDILG